MSLRQRRAPIFFALLLAPLCIFVLSVAARAQQGTRASASAAAEGEGPRVHTHRSRDERGSRHRGEERDAPDAVSADAAVLSDARAEEASAEPSASAAPSAAPSAAGETAPHVQRRVFVGIYPFHVPQLDLTTNSYLVDFWLWFRWQGEDNDPSKTFEFMNLYEGWDTLRQPVYVDDEGNARPESLGDGWRYQVFHIQARFGHAFDVRKYPFDTQEIVIAIEDTDATSTDQVYVADEGTRLRHATLDLPGWRIARIDADVRETIYPTNFGDTRRPVGEDRYSQFRYSIHIERPALGYMATTILPVAIVMLITFVMFAIHSKYFEGRLGLGITSLISAVALQLTAAGDLPKTGYLVLLDHVYNLSYLVIFLSLLESVVAVRWWDDGREEASKRLDRWALVVLSVLFFGGTALLVILR